MTGAGFLLVLLMSAVEPMPHSFELFWLHVGTADDRGSADGIGNISYMEGKIGVFLIRSGLGLEVYKPKVGTPKFIKLLCINGLRGFGLGLQ